MHRDAFCLSNSLFTDCQLSAHEDNLPRGTDTRFGKSFGPLALFRYTPAAGSHYPLPGMDGSPARMGNHPGGNPCGQFEKGQEPAQPAPAFKQIDRSALLEHGDGERTMGDSGRYQRKQRLAEPSSDAMTHKQGYLDPLSHIK